ncbi:MAG: hypothetical protein Q9186_001826 [Xanthomendoza sp. 1 TL-2023]
MESRPHNATLTPHHQRAATLPITITPSPAIFLNPSTSSDSSASLSSSNMSTKPSTATSSPDHLDIHEDFAPLDRMASTINVLQQRIAELETRFRDMEEEIEHWKGEAERMKVEDAGWYLF